ncbi:hypothetical protein MKX01_026847 [Papaver californicum]|nr:hypothetical protein MKX01_026847 [Papaver californicum]
MDIRTTTTARASAVRDKMSPERVRLSYVHHHHHHQQRQHPKVMNNNVVISKPFRKVQVLYYICRSNGQLEHPHFVEVTHLSTQHLRLKDFIDRLTVLRGKSMPSLFSWSCKRSYKNGYVWNDLSDNDIIYPAEGAEYILKGSELIEGCSEQFQQIQVTKKQNPESKYHSKRRLLVVPSQNRETDLGFMNRTESDDDEEEVEEVRKNSTSSTKSSSQCSRGISTEEDDEHIKTQDNNPSEITLEDTTNYSPPSSSSTISEKTHHTPKTNNDHNSVTESNRSSILFQLIACGSSNAIRERNAAAQKSIMPAPPPPPPPPVAAARKSNCSSNLHRGVLCKNINTAIKMSEEEEDDEINYMPENPRFGNPQSEEKEYFSGSIVESITERDRVIEGTESSRLKKSSSYNEERSRKSGLGLEPISSSKDEKNEEEEESKKKKKNMKGGHYCIPILTCNNK